MKITSEWVGPFTPPSPPPPRALHPPQSFIAERESFSGPLDVRKCNWCRNGRRTHAFFHYLPCCSPRSPGKSVPSSMPVSVIDRLFYIPQLRGVSPTTTKSLFRLSNVFCSSFFSLVKCVDRVLGIPMKSCHPSSIKGLWQARKSA